MSTQTELLAFKLEATGDEELIALARGLREVGAAGGEAAPQAEALLSELAGLADTARRATGLTTLKAQLQEIGDELAIAKLKQAEFQAAVDATLEPTAAQTRALERATASVAALDAKYNTFAAAVTRESNALAAAGVDTAKLDSEQRRLQGDLDGVRARAQGATAAFREQSAAEKAEGLSIETLSQKYGAFGRIVESVKSILIGIGSLFALEKAKEEIGEILATGDKFRKWGDDFGDAFGNAELGAEALERVKEIAEQTPLSLDQVAEAALKAKKEGLDPLDGSLLALIDSNAKYGKDVDTLNATIEALGKAWNRGALSQKEFVSLQQSGIPVARLLGEALNKTADEIEDMAKKGEIGRESIKLLIQQLGESAAGNAKDELNTLSATVTKLRDQWDEFLKLISDGGAYDFVLGKLQALTASIRQGLADGTLRQTAQQISDAIVKIGQGAAATAKFLYDHSAAILEAARAYVVFRTALFAIDLAGAAARMLTLATATKAAGEAAAGAAAAGAFGKLRSVVNGLPSNVKIAVAAVGIDVILSQTEKLYEGLKGIYETNEQIRASERERANDLTVLAARASTVAASLAGYAKAQIDDADALAKKNRQQSADYIESLENSTRYYTALRIQAQAVGDADGVRVASEKLKTLSEAIDAAREHFNGLAKDISKTQDSVIAVVNRFDELKTRGENAASAIAGAFDHIDLQTPQGIKDAIAILQQVAIRSREARDAVQTELGAALAKLNDTDLRRFQDQLKQSTNDANTLKLALGAALQEELARLGLSAEQVGAKFTEQGQKIISTFSDIVGNANATGSQIQLAFAKALSQAQTGGEVDALKAKLQEAFNAGRISADQFQAASEAAGRKLAAVQVAAAQASAELDGMGTSGVSAAQRISGALQQTRDALVAQANQMAQAINAALAAGDTASADRLRAQFKALDTEIASLNAQIDDLTPSYEDAADAGEDSARRQAAAMDRLASHIGRGGSGGGPGGSVTDAVDEAGDAAAEAQRQFTEWGTASGKTAQQLGADTSHANEGMDALVQGITNARNQYLSLSDAAAKFYDTALKGNFDLGHSDDGSGFDRVARAMQAALKATDAEIAANRDQLRGMVVDLDNIGSASSRNFGGFGNDAKTASKRMGELSDLIAKGDYQFGLLGKEDLQPLQQALDAARQKVEAIAARAVEAKSKLADMASTIHDELLQELGDEQALEDERHKKVMDDLQQEAQFAGSSNDQTYQQALQDEQRLHDLKMQKIREQQAAQQQQQQQTSSGGGTSGSSSGGGPTAPAQPTTTSGGTTFTHDVNVSITGGLPAGSLTDQQIDEIGYQIIQQLKRDRNR